LHELGDAPKNSNGWDGVRSWRNEQRRRLKALRGDISEHEQAKLSEQIRQNLARELQPDSRCLAFYWPLPGEPDLRPMICAHIRKGGHAAIAVIARKNQSLEFWHWDKSTVMEKGGVWDIPTPMERRVVAPDVILVPLVGFDKDGHRLGNGGGYYDRTLAALVPKPLCIGIGNEAGAIETIYPQQHDVPMDAIVTERGCTWKAG
jgi:5-formyltetrahydrofolate cyclo-ligase